MLIVSIGFPGLTLACVLAVSDFGFAPVLDYLCTTLTWTWSTYLPAGIIIIKSPLQLGLYLHPFSTLPTMVCNTGSLPFTTN